VRATYAALALVTIAIGLTVHLYGEVLGAAWRDILGDALWAGMIAWWVAALDPELSLGVRCAAALSICFAVELSQLMHTPTLDALRRTTIGRLTLGSGFDPRDLLSYAAGVLVAAFLEQTGRRWLDRRSQPAVV
jgi:hypothetical protein